MRRGTRKWAGQVGAALLVTLVLGYVPYHVYARSGLARTLQLRRELGLLHARNVDLRFENERLAREAEALRSDPEAIERVARAELGWVRPGEVIVDLSRASGMAPSAIATAANATTQTGSASGSTTAPGNTPRVRGAGR